MRKFIGLISMHLIGGISLIAFGWLMGSTPSSTSFVDTIFGWLVDIGTIAAGVGTIAASRIAYLALSAWKLQQKGQSKLSLLLENQAHIAVMSVEFGSQGTFRLDSDIANDLHIRAKKVVDNFAVISRIENDCELAQSLYRSSKDTLNWFIHNRRFGGPDIEKLVRLECQLHSYIAKF
ncbi:MULTISPECIES: hypothetical protein [Vibrio]|uniref:hypothetical protein n=1 Tax=Vibrio TaxID=662 RepID=UPI0011315A52|nr:MULTISPECIES: hypothetical protein [Vibrio]EIC9816967.1 hypothetical protein [Vibrio alginolyticus]